MQDMGRFIGEFQGDVMRELLVDDDNPAMPLFHRSAIRLSTIGLVKKQRAQSEDMICSCGSYRQTWVDSVV